MVTRVPTDQQDVEYSEYQPMIKIPTDVQNTNRHYPSEILFKIPSDDQNTNHHHPPEKMFKILKRGI